MTTEQTTSTAAVGEGASTTAPILEQPGSTDTRQSTDWKALVPTEYQEKPYIQELLKHENPGPELFKQFDNLQKMLGSRNSTGVPTAEASQDEWDRFFGSLAPASADEYDLTTPEFGEADQEFADFYKQYRTDEDIKAAKELALQHKIPAKLFGPFAKAWEARQVEQIRELRKAQKEAETRLDGEFETLMKQNFGGDIEKVRTYAKDFVAKHAPGVTKETLTGWPNEILIQLASMAQSVHKMYEKPDSFNPPATSASAVTESDLQAELTQLQSQKSYYSSLDTDHPKTMARVHEITKQLAELRKKRS
jgi:hypothetical protein